MAKFRLKTRRKGQTGTYVGPHGPIRVAYPDSLRTLAHGRSVPRSNVKYGPATSGPFGEVKGWVGDLKLIVRLAPWGTEVARHALEVQVGDNDYVIRSPGRIAQPTLERVDGTVVARLHPLIRFVSDDISPAEAVLVALILGSGLHRITLPQAWFARA
jgi:hypothetical protein